MDLQKFGCFIAKLRKNNNLTQNDVGNFLGVNSKTVSKWERGINAPDISLLNKMSELFCISTTDLLNCNDNFLLEKKLDNNNIKQINKIKRSKNSLYMKNLKISGNILIMVIFLILLLFWIGNYNKCFVFSVNSDNSDFEVEGKIIINQYQNIYLINKVRFINEFVGTNIETKVKKVTVSLHNKNKILFIMERNFDDEFLSKALLDFDINITDGDNIKNKEYLEELKKLYITVDYVDNIDENVKIDVPLLLKKEFSNNKVFYQN